MKVEKIGLLGFGTVGSGVYHILTKNQMSIEKKTGVSLRIEKALVKEPELFADKISGITFTSDVDYILNDEEISIIVEVLGGVDFAYNCVKKALESGKHVVTANKDLLAKHGVELSQIARENNVYLYYEASVGGGIPVLRPLVEHVSSNEVEAIYGIVNGTTNFILTSMSQQGLSYEEVLKTAQEKGFAEADPTSDVEGYDATYKLIILTRLAFGTNVSFDAIPKKGITQVTKTDLQLAKLSGYTIKLLASVVANGEEVYLEVRPYFVSLNHLLAQVAYENNAISVTGDALGEILLYGKGAGSHPTATSVVADIMMIATQQNRNAKVVPFEPLTEATKVHTTTAPLKDYAVVIETSKPEEFDGVVLPNQAVLTRFTQISEAALEEKVSAYQQVDGVEAVRIYPVLEA